MTDKIMIPKRTRRKRGQIVRINFSDKNYSLALVQQEHPSIEHAGDARREQSGAGNKIEPETSVMRNRCGRGSRPLAANDFGAISLCVMQDDRDVVSDAAVSAAAQHQGRKIRPARLLDGFDRRVLSHKQNIRVVLKARRRSEPRSFRPPASAIACLTVNPGSRMY